MTNEPKHPDQPIENPSFTKRLIQELEQRYLIRRRSRLESYELTDAGRSILAVLRAVDEVSAAPAELQCQDGQVRVFRHDIQQWVEVPSDCIAWGPDTKAVTCRAELTCRFEFGAPPWYRHYVPYILDFTGDRSGWAVRISFPADDSIIAPEEENGITARALHVLRQYFPGASLDFVVADRHRVHCIGKLPIEAVTATGERARWILHGFLPGARP